MKRPTAVTVFAVLNIVFGVFALFGVFGALVNLAASDEAKNPVARIMHENADYATWVKCTIPIGLLSFVLLLASGIGLLMLAEWARKLSLAYGVYAILMDIAVAVANFKFIPLILAATMRNSGLSDSPSPAVGGTVASVSAIMGGVFGLIYPVLLLVFMTRPNISAAFRPPAEPPVLPAD